jgi:hypothetical protein
VEKYEPVLERKKWITPDQLEHINQLKEDFMLDWSEYGTKDPIYLLIPELAKLMFHDDPDEQLIHSELILTALQLKYEDDIKRRPSRYESYINKIRLLEEFVGCLGQAHMDYMYTSDNESDEITATYQ